MLRKGFPYIEQWTSVVVKFLHELVVGLLVGLYAVLTTAVFSVLFQQHNGSWCIPGWRTETGQGTGQDYLWGVRVWQAPGNVSVDIMILVMTIW